jgi:hypothetical protein
MPSGPPYRLRDDERPDEEEPEDLEDEPPEDDERDGAETRLPPREDDLDGELTLGALRDEPEDRYPELRPPPLDRDGAEARGEGALRLPLEVRGTTGERRELDLFDDPVRGMTTGDLLEGTARLEFEVRGTIGERLYLEPPDASDFGTTIGDLAEDAVPDRPRVDLPALPELRDVDRPAGVRTDGETGLLLDPPDRDLPEREAGALLDEPIAVRPVPGARDCPDGEDEVLVDGEDRVPEGEATELPTDPRPNPALAPPGARVDRKRFPPEERPVPRSEAS